MPLHLDRSDRSDRSFSVAACGVLAGVALLSVAAGAVTGATSQTLSTKAEVDAFATALGSCSAAKAATPHPLMRAFVIEHTVTAEHDGKCDYRQTMPGKMTMVCALSAEGRKGLSSQIRAMAAGGAMSGSTSAAPPTWMRECEIETPDGKRIPAVSGRGGGAGPAPAR